LLNRLHEIPPGRDGWPAYKKFCEDLLNFLFVPPLNPAIAQSRDDRGANRRDYVLPNYAVDGGFWQFMRAHYNAHYVVAEVKNLTRRPGKQEILQVANYLNPHGTGLFALVLARTELNATATWICWERWVQRNKLIIGINDDPAIDPPIMPTLMPVAPQTPRSATPGGDGNRSVQKPHVLRGD
jgi:hypothetical protein